MSAPQPDVRAEAAAFAAAVRALPDPARGGALSVAKAVALAALRSTHATEASVIRVLVYRRSLEDLCVETDEPLRVVLEALHEMWLSGLVTGDRCDGYQLVSAIRAG